MSRRIKLTRLEQERAYVPNIGNGFRLVVQASDGYLMPDEVFLFQRVLLDPNTNTYDDEMVAVCSPIDLSTYPTTRPAEGQTPAFFRKAVADLTLPSQTMAASLWAELHAEVTRLVSALNVMDTLVTQEETWVGSAPDESGGSD